MALAQMEQVERPVPYDISAEEAVLGSLLIDRDAITASKTPTGIARRRSSEAKPRAANRATMPSNGNSEYANAAR